MLKFFVTCSVLAHYVVLGMEDRLNINKGTWSIDYIGKCPDYEQEGNELHKRKVNRTHDGFYGDLKFTEDITEEDYGIIYDVCKKVDGGCKSIIKYEDDCFCRIIEHYLQENFRRALKNLGVEPRCPIPKGSYKLDDFVFNSAEMSDSAQMGSVGEYEGIAWLTKNSEKVACQVVYLSFSPEDLLEDDE